MNQASNQELTIRKTFLVSKFSLTLESENESSCFKSLRQDVPEYCLADVDMDDIRALDLPGLDSLYHPLELECNPESKNKLPAR